MLEYAKVILPKVSFNKELFTKELLKCISWVDDSELDLLKDWCFKNFEHVYPEILAKAFEMEAA